MKRTVLDIEGVFSHESLMARPEGMFGARFTSTHNDTDDGLSYEEAMTSVLTKDPVKLDLNQIATGLSLNPAQVEELVTGKSSDSLQDQALADSVMYQLSAEDRAALERISD